MARILMGLTAVAIVASLSFADDKDDEKKVQAELKQLEGSWQLVSSVKDGKEAPDEVVKSIRLVIKDSKHTVYRGDDFVVKEIPFKLDLSQDPKRSVDTLPDGKQIKAIYKIEDDTLTSCSAGVDKDFPKEFSGAEGLDQTLRVLKRIKDQ